MSEFLDVQAYADGELSPEQIEALKAQISSNSQLDAELQSVTILKSTLQRTVTGVSDDECWAKCKERIALIDKTTQTNSFVSRYAWGICGSLVAGIMVMGVAQRGMNANKPFDPSSVANLASALGSGTTTKQAPSQFDRWLNQVQILEQQQGLYEGKPAASVLLQNGNGRYRLFIIANCSSVDGACETKKFVRGEVDGLNTVSWGKEGYAFTIAGKNKPEELEALATRLFGPQ